MEFTHQYLSRAESAILVTLLAYFLLNGAQVFETAVIVPKWTADPPASLSLLKGINLKSFWIIAHSIHEITFVAAIVLCWKIGVIRNWLLILFAVHFVVRVWTLAYFAPNIISFQKSTYDTSAAAETLFAKVTMWKQLNYIRVGIFIAVSCGIIPLLLKVIRMKS
ncbi:transposase [Chitinophaga horti]|uniref:Transposase n=1 Tax=Chitinophaga horti TaxID=2920382 RepID=A0ABY6J1D9_9BACT|nr:transposase [Chitinophaga horti]UYQ91967.1 transposase [Chitinophaga horti]